MPTINTWNNNVSDANVSFTGGTMSIGTDASTNSINIGTGSAARAVALGNTSGASSLNLRCGTGDASITSATGILMTANDTGQVTKPLQPSFLATASAVSSVTGDGTLYTIIFNNETYDINSNFDGTSTFTAPVSGTYLFSILIDATNIASANTQTAVYLTTSNRNFSIDYSNWYPSVTSNEMVKAFSFLAYLDASDTALVKIKVSNGSKGVNLTTSTSFSGFLLG